MANAENTQEMLQRKNKQNRQVLRWMEQLDEHRQFHMGRLKEFRADHDALEKVLFDSIKDDNFSLFPDAELSPPKSLTDSTAYWLFIDFEDGKKKKAAKADDGEDVPHLACKLEAARLESGEFVGKLYIRTSEVGNDRGWFSLKSRDKVGAAHELMTATRGWIEQAPALGVPKKDLLAIAASVLKFEESMPAVISAPGPDWRAPQVDMKSAGITEEQLSGATLPDHWGKGEVPRLVPLAYSGRLYAVTAAEVDSLRRGWTLTEIHPREGWFFRVVSSKTDALDGALCGLQVADEASPMGHPAMFVIGQQTTQVKITSWNISGGPDELLGLELVETDSLPMPGDDVRAEVNVATVEKPADIAKAFNPEACQRVLALAALNPAPEDAVDVYKILYDGTRAFLNVGVSNDTGLPENIHLLIPLYAVDDGEEIPPVVPQLTMDTWENRLFRAANRKGQVRIFRVGNIEGAMLFNVKGGRKKAVSVEETADAAPARKKGGRRKKDD